MQRLTTEICGTWKSLMEADMARLDLPRSSMAARVGIPATTFNGQLDDDTSPKLNYALKQRERFTPETRISLATTFLGDLGVIHLADSADVPIESTVMLRALDASANMVELTKSVAKAEADGIWTTGELAALARDIAGIIRRLNRICLMVSASVARNVRNHTGFRRHA